jgi:hypothetical protein
MVLTILTTLWFTIVIAKLPISIQS